MLFSSQNTLYSKAGSTPLALIYLISDQISIKKGKDRYINNFN